MADAKNFAKNQSMSCYIRLLVDFRSWAPTDGKERSAAGWRVGCSGVHVLLQ